MMKKATKLIRIISTALGVALLFLGGYRYKGALNEIATNTNYTWEPPFTDYENKIFFQKWSSLGCTVIGAAILILMIIRLIYLRKRKKVVNVEQSQDTAIEYESVVPNNSMGVENNVSKDSIQESIDDRVKENIEDRRNNDQNAILEDRNNDSKNIFSIESKINDKMEDVSSGYQPKLYIYSEEENLKFARPKTENK
ncbi:MAG: hypothetical protein Q4G58_15500 [bacterium]|nr:hypothetical protein [bacterium]